MTQIRLGTPGDAARERELWQLAFGDDGAYVDNFYQTYYKPERMLLLEEDGVVQSMTAWFDTQLVLPRERELWQLAFGDDGAYVDNFYQTYYKPERMLLLEEDGVVQSMTAWFDTQLVLPGEGRFRAAYLYAVATDPAARGRGLAGRLLAGADEYFRGLAIPAVTTVPAEPSLHNFFGANGFRECFTLFQEALDPGELPAPAWDNPLRPVSPAEYGAVREKILADCPHIAYPEEALAYQAGCCALSGGGLFAGETEDGPVCACAEGDGAGLVVYKELLGTKLRTVLPHLPRMVPGERFLVRGPLAQRPAASGGWQFGMLKWLSPDREEAWDWSRTAYLGLAFD